MRDRVVLAITVLFLALVAGPLLSGWSAQSAIAQEPASYSFTECEEGWTVTESFTEPQTARTWERSRPGADSPDGFAFRSFPYPTGAPLNDPQSTRNYEASVTSLSHLSTGNEVTIGYSVMHDLEACCDFMFLEWSSDGAKWNEAVKFEGLSEGYVSQEWVVGETKIKPPAGNFYLRFRLFSDPLISGEEAVDGQVAFDEVSVTLPRPAGATCGEDEPSNSPSQTTTATATSTATPTQTPTATTPPTNPPKRCTERGTSKGETLRGTREPDRICARGGNDKLYGLRANDMLIGGKGRDLLVGGLGRDTCRGGAGKDRFKGCETKRQ